MAVDLKQLKQDGANPGEGVVWNGSIWAPGAVGGTLDAAYDFGGSGAGRVITVDSGAVRLNKGVNDATNALEVVVTTGTGAGLSVVMTGSSGTGITVTAGTATGAGAGLNVTAASVTTGSVARFTGAASQFVDLGLTYPSAGGVLGFSRPTDNALSSVIGNAAVGSGLQAGVCDLELFGTAIRISSDGNANNSGGIAFIISPAAILGAARNTTALKWLIKDTATYPLQGQTGSVFGWTGSTDASAALTTTLSQHAAGRVQIGTNGANASGSFFSDSGYVTNNLVLSSTGGFIWSDNANPTLGTQDTYFARLSSGLVRLTGTSGGTTNRIQLGDATQLRATGTFGWSATTQASDAADTGLSRTAAATMALGNGTASNASGTMVLATLEATSAIYAGGLPSSNLYTLIGGADIDLVQYAASAPIGNGTIIRGLFKRGTHGSPTNAASGDYLFDLIAVGTTNGNYSAIMSFVASAAAGANSIPTDIAIAQCSTGAVVNAAETFRFKAAGTLASTSTGVYGWCAAADLTTSADTGLSRIGAASVAIGNGTQGNASGLLQVLQLGVGGVAESTNQLHVYAATAKVAIESTTNTNTAGLRFLTKDSGGTGRNGGLYMLPGTTTATTWFAWSPTDVNTPWAINQAQTIVGHGSGMIIGWSATANDGTAALDTGFSRTGAATVALGNGTASNASGTLSLASVNSSGLVRAGLATSNSVTIINQGDFQEITYAASAVFATNRVEGIFNRGTVGSPTDATTGDHIFTIVSSGTVNHSSDAYFDFIASHPSSGGGTNVLPTDIAIGLAPVAGNAVSVDVFRFKCPSIFAGVSTATIGWVASTDLTAALDVGLSRLGAASIAVGNGAAADVSGSIQAAQFAVATSVFWTSGTGSPNGVVTANPGSLYSDKSGGTSVTLYVKESGTGTNTGWVAK